MHLSQQLAEARHKIQTVVSQDKDRAEHCEEQLRKVQDELENMRQREKKVSNNYILIIYYNIILDAVISNFNI